MLSEPETRCRDEWYTWSQWSEKTFHFYWSVIWYILALMLHLSDEKKRKLFLLIKLNRVYKSELHNDRKSTSSRQVSHSQTELHHYLISTLKSTQSWDICHSCQDRLSRYVALNSLWMNEHFHCAWDERIIHDRCHSSVHIARWLFQCSEIEQCCCLWFSRTL